MKYKNSENRAPLVAASVFYITKFEGTEDRLEQFFGKIMNENDFNDFDAITRFQAYQAQRRYKKLFLFFPFFKK